MHAGAVRLVVLGLVGLAVAATAAAHDADVPGRNCGSLALAPQTDFVAARIFVIGTSCRRAREIVRLRQLHHQRRPAGYRCTRWSHDDRLIHDHVRCAKGGAVVRWAQY